MYIYIYICIYIYIYPISKSTYGGFLSHGEAPPNHPVLRHWLSIETTMVHWGSPMTWETPNCKGWWVTVISRVWFWRRCTILLIQETKIRLDNDYLITCNNEIVSVISSMINLNMGITPPSHSSCKR